MKGEIQMKQKIGIPLMVIFLLTFLIASQALGKESTMEKKRLRAREMGIVVGILPPGPHNAITDVPGVKVGHCTVIKGDDIRTGVTAILPHGGNIFQKKVPAAIYLGNAYGKLTGYTQVEELGEIETPVLLTGTLNVPKVADGLMQYMLSLPGNEDVWSINPVVGETNDGWLSDGRSRPLGFKEVKKAIENGSSGLVEEGCVGAGTGTECYSFKGGIGTSSRVLPKNAGGYTIGVLVQTNFGGILQINGAPVGRELNRFYSPLPASDDDADGSCMIVVATDAPLLSRNLKRLARRAIFGMVRTGSFGSNGSGDYVIAFTTNESLRITSSNPKQIDAPLKNYQMSALFLAVMEATEEAILNSMFKATSMTGRDGHHLEAIPLDKVLEICKKYNALHWDKTLPSKRQK
jgi:D-aminopeptidase